jgi:hypothetical protein
MFYNENIPIPSTEISVIESITLICAIKINPISEDCVIQK